MKTDSSDQQPNVLDKPEQVRFNDLLNQLKRVQKNIDMSLFEEVFGHKNLTKCYKLCTI